MRVLLEAGAGGSVLGMCPSSLSRQMGGGPPTGEQACCLQAFSNIHAGRHHLSLKTAQRLSSRDSSSVAACWSRKGSLPQPPEMDRRNEPVSLDSHNSQRLIAYSMAVTDPSSLGKELLFSPLPAW